MIGEEIRGGNGEIEVVPDGVVLKRKGLVAAIKHGAKGDKRIPFSSITAVQFKLPDWITTGYIQFSIMGGIESVGGVFAATSDENTVTFQKPALQDFLRLRAYVESAMRAARLPAARTQHVPLADELAKLADLHDKGVLTSDEFAALKARALQS